MIDTVEWKAVTTQFTEYPADTLVKVSQSLFQEAQPNVAGVGGLNMLRWNTHELSRGSLQEFWST